MLSRIISKDSLLNQANILKKKRFKQGFDGMSADGAAAWIFINGDRLCKDITLGRYTPMPTIGFRTAKSHGRYRELVRLTALDTIIQMTLNDYLSPVLDESFHDSSFAYRHGRGVHSALEKYVDIANNYRYTAKVDLLSYFSNIDHEVLSNILSEYISDTKLCRLIMAFVSTPISVDGEINNNNVGLLQGMPLSPLLCNLYLTPLDKFMDENGFVFIRYADDFIIFGNSENELENRLKSILSFCENELRLKANQRKIKIAPPSEITYLGYKFTSDKKGLIAYDANSTAKAVYHNWYTHYPQNNRHRTDIISDGILRQKDFSLLFDTETQDVSIPIENTSVINIYSDVIFEHFYS